LKYRPVNNTFVSTRTTLYNAAKFIQATVKRFLEALTLVPPDQTKVDLADFGITMRREAPVPEEMLFRKSKSSF
jgi:hypothetical protein